MGEKIGNVNSKQYLCSLCGSCGEKSSRCVSEKLLPDY